MTTKTFKRLPYGASDFRSLRMENYAYVDKTRFIELLENETNKSQFFIRPRKFGKSLFFMTLSYYYDVNHAGQFEQLFGDLYIGKHPTPGKNRYAVMEFDFSGIDTTSEEGFKHSFLLSIAHTVCRFLQHHRNIFPDADVFIRQINEGTLDGFSALLKAFDAANDAGIQIFIIIDEYDHFANDLIAMGTMAGTNFYKNVVTANGLVRDFYEMLKIATKSSTIVHTFITGISPVMLDDLTSGYNIAVNLTLKPRYNEMMGFTRQEVEALREETGVDAKLINIDMEKYYNGYLFNEKGENRIYNPSMILYVFSQILEEGEPPKNIIDDNLKTDYNRLRRLIHVEENRNKLQEIVRNGGIISEIISKFPIDRLEDTKYFTSMLFYMGLLTIDKYEQGQLYLKIPNYSIRTVYWEYFEQLILDFNEEVSIDTAKQSAAVWQLAYKSNLQPYIEYVSRQVFRRLSNRDLQQFDEKYIKIMLLNGFFQSNLYVPLTETEVENGYVDIYLQRSPRLPDIPCEWVLEIKYIKKSQAKTAKTAREEARLQLEKYRCSQRFAGRDDLRFASLLFIGKDKYEIEEY
jgi:hypothetical protein